MPTANVTRVTASELCSCDVIYAKAIKAMPGIQSPIVLNIFLENSTFNICLFVSQSANGLRMKLIIIMTKYGSADNNAFCLILKCNTLFIYDGISVSNVQNPQLCAECAITKLITADDVKISFQGVLMIC